MNEKAREHMKYLFIGMISVFVCSNLIMYWLPEYFADGGMPVYLAYGLSFLFSFGFVRACFVNIINRDEEVEMNEVGV